MKFPKAILALLMMIFVSSGCTCNGSRDHMKQVDEGFEFGQGENAFALAFSTSVQGWVEPCGCTSQPLGGIARLATVVQTARKHFSLGSMFIDGGDLLFDSKEAPNPADLCQENARIDLLLSALKDLSLEGTFSRDFDNSMGLEFRNEVFARHQIQDLTLRAREGFISGSTKFKVGVILLEPNTSTDLNLRATKLLEKGAEVVVGISHLSRIQTKEIALTAPAIDLIILAGVSEEIPAPAEIIDSQGTILVSAAKQGQYLGLVEFHKAAKAPGKTKWVIDNRKQQRANRIILLTQRSTSLSKQLADANDEVRKAFLQERWEDAQIELNQLKAHTGDEPMTGNVIVATSVALSREIPAESTFDARLKDYERRIPGLVAQCEANVDCPKLAKGASGFVGAESCMKCHAAAYAFWKKAVYDLPVTDEKGNAIVVKSGHSKAWETLESKTKTEDRSCIGCHSVGFMQPGGYCKVKEVGALKNVQCESCHGAGELHAKTADKRLIRRDVPESACRECHHVPHIPTTESFVYSEKVEKILGQGHGELFLQKLKHGSSDSLPKNIQ